MVVRAEFVTINSVPTFVRTWGKWIEEPLYDVSELILVIPGNPGVTSFYTFFLSRLYENLNGQIPIWIIGEHCSELVLKELTNIIKAVIVGHAGHEEESRYSIPTLIGNENLFNIEGQVRSKLEFIEKFIPPHIKIHLIGHSFGTCQSLDLIRSPKVKKQIEKCYLLFPTFERRRGTKSAKSFDKMYLFYNIIGFWLAILFSKLPKVIRYLVFSIYLMVKGTHQDFVDSYIMAAEPGVMEKSLYLTNESNEVYDELDVDLLRTNKELFILFYGGNDGWVPPQYYIDMKTRVPMIDARFYDDLHHMFVFKSSVEMADILKKEIVKND